MRPTRPLPLLLALALLAGCGALPPEAEAPPERPSPLPEPPPARQSVSIGDLVSVARGGEGAIGRLGPPARVDAEPVENLHVPGQVDTLRTYHYDGLRVEVYDVADSARMLLTSVIVTSERYDAGLGVRVGATRAAVEAALGAPEERAAGAYEYLLADPEGGAENYLWVRFDGDRVRELAWSFYVD